MGLRLSVQRDAWLRHIEMVASALPHLIPVVKGNGYGFGRPNLMPVAARITHPGGSIGVGTVYEAIDVPAGRVPLVLTPHVDHLPTSLPVSAVLTVGGVAHIDALRKQSWTGRVSIKLASGMHRYGVAVGELGDLHEAVRTAGLTPVGYSVHLPLVGDASAHRAEIAAWLPHLDPSLPVAVSHFDAENYQTLRDEHASHSFEFRSGTALWHGTKTMMHLSADVLDVHTVSAGTVAGYRATPVPGDGHLVLVGAGAAHGVHPLDDGRSPFHFAKHRLTLLEPPHMHTSMLFVATRETVPIIGDRVDVQRPLITTTIDELAWVDD